MRFLLVVTMSLFYSAFAWASSPDCKALATADLTFRQQLPETDIPKEHWQDCCGSWGPRPAIYPVFSKTPECSTSEWLHDRAILVAMNFVGLPYLHRHIPAMGGLDCSNFTAWVYNFGFGIKIDSNIQRQADSAGHRLSLDEPLLPGDLLFFWASDKQRIGHAAIYRDEKFLIDSTGPGVQIRAFSGWYKERFAWARRVID